MNILKIKCYFTAVIAIIMLLSGCVKNTIQGAKEIQFAVMGDKALYDYDESLLNGVRMAIDDCNELYGQKGFHVSMELYDDEGIYEKGIIIAHSIVEDEGITAVLGSQNYNIINSAAEIFENAEKIFITPDGANDETLNEGYSFIFRNTHSSNDMGISLAQYAINNGFHKLAVCIKGPEYIEEFIRSFYRESQNSDLRIVDYYTKTNTGDEFEEVFERWELLGVDCVVIIHDSMPDAFNLLRATRSKAPSMMILGDTNFDFKEKLEEYGEFSDNIVITELLSMEHGEKQKLFESRYVEHYEAKPDDYALQGYESIKMIVDTAVSIDTNDSALIAQELHKSGYDGIAGTICFDEKGNLLSRLPKILISKDGVFQEVRNE